MLKKLVTKLSSMWRNVKQKGLNHNIVKIAKLLGFVIFVLGLLYFIFIIIRPAKREAPLPQIIVPVVYKDKSGKQYAQTTTHEGTKQDVRALVDSLKLELKRNGSPFSVTQYIYKVDTIVKVKNVYIDTVMHRFSMDHTDRYISLSVQGDRDSGSFRLKSMDSITFVLSKKKHLFKSNEIIVTSVNTNPYNAPVGVRSVTLREAKPILVFGPQFGMGIPTFKPYMGIGVTVPIFSIKTRK